MHEQLRSLPLQSVLSQLGVNTTWKSRKGGSEWAGTCPVHKPKKNASSFSFDVEGRFNCFSCGAKGRGAIDLTMAVKACGFQEAVTWLQSQELRQMPSETSHEIAKLQGQSKAQSEQLENSPYKASYEKFAVKSLWLEKRGLSPEALAYFGVFEYNNPNRVSKYKGKILFPILRFRDGELVGYLSRNPLPATDDEPKYRFPPNFAKHLEVFGAFQLKGQARLRRGYLVESPLCVMKFWQMGLPAVSPFGVSLSSEQAVILASLAKGWTVLPDADRRGECLKAVLPLLGQHCWVKCPEFPASDPEHLEEDVIRSL